MPFEHNNDSASRHVLFVGGPNAGKTTYLVQLYARMQAQECRLRLRRPPSDLSLVSQSLQRLSQGRPLRHTSEQVRETLTLPVIDRSGVSRDIKLPDYGGEALRTIVTRRRVPNHWRELINRTGHWLLFIRLEQMPQIPDILTKAIGELAMESVGDKRDNDAVSRLPYDLWMIELLQIMVHTRENARFHRRDPQLTVVLTCWDELRNPEDFKPSEYFGKRLPLLRSYIEATWVSDARRVLGLSSQGKELSESEKDEEIIDKGLTNVGYVVREDGSRDGDLTLPLID